MTEPKSAQAPRSPQSPQSPGVGPAPVSAATGSDDSDQGHSLWSDAWRRLKRNRVALFSMFYVLAIALVGIASPLVASCVTHFSPTEQHSGQKNLPPGAKAMSRVFPAWDGRPDGFAQADLDGDGAITCRWIGADGGEAKADGTDELVCPELELLERLAREHYDKLLPHFDKARGASAPVPGVFQKDGYLSWLEFPKDDLDLVEKLRGYGLSGPQAFRDLDINGDNVIAPWEVVERTRHLRYTTNTEDQRREGFEAFILDHDRNGDLKITASEYPGAPVLRTMVMGSDGNGRDVMTRLSQGARLSMMVGIAATLVSLFIGVIYGAVSGYMGGRVDNIMMRIVDVLYGLPFMFLVILLLVMFGREIYVLFLALGAVQWLNMARVVRGQVISLKNQEFVEAARAIGASRRAIIFRHLIRNAIGPVVVYSTLMVPAVIMEEAFLSFLGLLPDVISWGTMLNEGVDVFRSFPWLLVFPAVALATTLFAMNFLGDGIRDAIDPKMQGR